MTTSDSPNNQIPFVPGIAQCRHRGSVRTLRDVAAIFQDRAAVEARLAAANPTIYEFHEHVTGHNRGDLVVATCRLMPGKIGNEFYMTRGHFHAPADFAEVYYVQSGIGLLLLQSPDGRFVAEDMHPGTILYIPPNWFHRSVNVGDQPLVFFGVYSGEADHDYGAEAVERWIARIVVDVDAKAVIVDNPQRTHRDEALA
jgi:glucose-6-phosphate isomerase, archaeal